MEEALYVLRIASKSGWPEDYIRHQLPLARGWAYYHAACLLDGERCRWPGTSSGVSKWVDGAREWMRKLRTTRTQKTNG